MKILFILLVSFFIAYLPATAHTDARKQQSGEQQNESKNNESSNSGGQQQGYDESGSGEHSESQNVATGPLGQPATLNSLFEHLHNKTVHFPVALSILGLVFSFLYLKNPMYLKPLVWTVSIAILFAVIAFFAGHAQEEHFEGTGKMWIVEIHETIGTITALSYFGWLIFLIIKPLNKYNWIMGLITAGLAFTAAFYGGSVAH